MEILIVQMTWSMVLRITNNTMKKSIILLSLFAMITAVSCSKDEKVPGDNNDKIEIILTKSQAKLVDSENTFAFSLFREMNGLESGSNLFLSPLSLHADLSMLSNGADGDTFAQIAYVLGFNGASSAEINEFYRTLIEGIFGVDKSVDLAIANSCWAYADEPFLPDFSKIAKDCYNADIYNVDLGNSVNDINGWCSSRTNGLIPEIITDIDSDVMYILLDAVYFKGSWQNRFDPKATENGLFTGSDGKKSNIPFMHGNFDLMSGYSSVLGASVCELPYGNGGFVMDIVLPDEETAFDDFVAGMDNTDWNDLISIMSSQRTRITFPKFETSCTMDGKLKTALSNMGMDIAFGPLADFSKMIAQSTSLGSVRLKSKITVDEEGSEAASVSEIEGIKWANAGNPFIFTADQPFVYVIRETSTGAIIFMGTYR